MKVILIDNFDFPKASDISMNAEKDKICLYLKNGYMIEIISHDRSRSSFEYHIRLFNKKGEQIYNCILDCIRYCIFGHNHAKEFEIWYNHIIKFIKEIIEQEENNE